MTLLICVENKQLIGLISMPEWEIVGIFHKRKRKKKRRRLQF